jgi:membrane-associated phospholipid phosphatase
MKAFWIYLGLAALTLAVFGLWPGIDLAVARLFFLDGAFDGDELSDRLLREGFRATPFVVLIGYGLLWAARRAGWSRLWAPSGKAMIFLVLTMAIGPGLIVNLGFKDHWHRPRPYQTQQFHGPSPFRAWYQADGQCDRNCSFVSGEAATGFWLVAPASLLPPPVRTPAVICALAFGTAVGVLRMAFGGHYMSDVILGGLVTLIVIEAVRKAMWPSGMPPAGASARRRPGGARAASKPTAAPTFF